MQERRFTSDPSCGGVVRREQEEERGASQFQLRRDSCLSHSLRSFGATQRCVALGEKKKQSIGTDGVPATAVNQQHRNDRRTSLLATSLQAPRPFSYLYRTSRSEELYLTQEREKEHRGSWQRAESVRLASSSVRSVRLRTKDGKILSVFRCYIFRLSTRVRQAVREASRLSLRERSPARPHRQLLRNPTSSQSYAQLLPLVEEIRS